MSKVKKAINEVIKKVKGNHDDVYAARFYDSTQVISILNDLLSVADDGETNPTTGGTITKSMINELVEALESDVKNNVDNINTFDLVDEDSFEISISGGSVSINDYDLDRDSIAESASETIRDTVYTWLEDNDIEMK